MEPSESSIYLSVFDTCSYDLLHLRIVSHSFSSPASSDLLFRKQRECCRALLKGIKSCLAAPTYGNSHLIMCAVRKGSISSLGELNKLLAKLDLELLKKEVATLKVLQLCLSFSLEASLCLKWNKISKWLLQGGDVLRNNGAIPAIEMGLLVAASQVCFTLKAGRLKVFPFDISELGLDQEILQYFLNDENAVITSSTSSAVRLGATVHVLPSLRQASIESISRQIPPSCPYKQLSSFIEHWKFTYGLEIPNDPSSTYYVNVKFSPTGTTYTYPHWCVHSRSPVILRRFDPTPILQDFINDVNELQMGLKLEVKGYKPVSSFVVTDQVLSPAFQNLEAHLPAVAGPYRTVNPRPTLKQQSIFEMLKNIKSPTKNKTSSFQSHFQHQNSQTMKGNAPVFQPSLGATSSSQSEVCATPSEKVGRVQPFVSETESQLRVGNMADVELNRKESHDVMNKTGLPSKYFQSQFITPKLNSKPWSPIKHPESGQTIADKGKANHTSKAGTEADGSSKYFLSKANNSKLPFKPRDKGKQTKLVPTIYFKSTDSENMRENLKSSHISESELMNEVEILKSDEIIEIATSTADSIYPYHPSLPQGSVTPFLSHDYDFISKVPSIEKESEKSVCDSEHYLEKNDKPMEIQVNTSSGMHKERVLPHDGGSSSSTSSSTPSKASQNVVINNLVNKPLQFCRSSVKLQVDTRPGYTSSSGKVNPSLSSNICRNPEVNEALKIISGPLKSSIKKAGTNETQTPLPDYGYSCSQGNSAVDLSACGTPINCGDKGFVNEEVKVSSGYVKSLVENVTMHRTTAFHRAFSSSQDNWTVNSIPNLTHHPQIAPDKYFIKEGVKSSLDSVKPSIEKVSVTIQNAVPSSFIQGHPPFKVNPCGTPQAIANNHLVNKVVRTESSFMKPSIEEGSTPAAHDKIVPVFVKKKVDSSAVLKPIIEHDPKPQKLIPSFMLKKKPTYCQAIRKDDSVKNMVRENDIADKTASVQGKSDCRNDLDTSSKSAICLEKKVPIFSQNKIQKPITSSPAFLKKPALDLKKKQKANKDSIKAKAIQLETPLNSSIGNKMLASYFYSHPKGVTSPQINSITSKVNLSTTEPSIFERLSELDLKNPAEFKELGKDFAETGKKRKKNDNQSSQNENGSKKPRAPPKIATNVNIEELAKLGQLSIVNVPTITAWLKAKGIQVKSKDKRQDLVNKVHISLGLPVQF